MYKGFKTGEKICWSIHRFFFFFFLIRCGLYSDGMKGKKCDFWEEGRDDKKYVYKKKRTEEWGRRGGGREGIEIIDPSMLNTHQLA